MVNLYLIKGTLETIPYMDEPSSEEYTGIVWGTSEENAIDVAREAIGNKGAPYCVSYTLYVDFVQCALGVPPFVVKAEKTD